jgi:hypothetical protein
MGVRKMSEESLKFKSAFKYPFNKAVRMFNILWMFVPFIGWFALFGYGIEIIKHFIKGDFKELPKMEFGKHLKLGFFMFLKFIPFIIVITIVNIVLIFIPIIGPLASWFVSLFVAPILVINFFNKETIESYFEFEIIRAVFDDFEEYIIALLKSLALAVIFFLMMIILVGIPAKSFTQNIFIADFYRRFVKK